MPSLSASEKRKVRFTFMVDHEVLRRLREVQSRTGASVAEQIRDGVKWWLDAHEWPADRQSAPRSATRREF
jgi:hypothetical protein